MTGVADGTDALQATLNALVGESVIAHAALTIGRPATARRAAIACQELAEEIVRAIPVTAVDPLDSDGPDDEDDASSWAAAAWGPPTDDDGGPDDNDPGGHG